MKISNVIAMGTAVRLSKTPYEYNSNEYKYSNPPYMSLMTR